MPDREKVIRGLECCVRTIEDCECTDNCPYETQCWDGTMYLDLMRDALALLREREPVEPVAILTNPARTVCGACGAQIPTPGGWRYKYCPTCGRGIKWDADD